MLGRALAALRDGMDADRLLQTSMASFIELAKSRYALDPGAEWSQGQPLRLLLAGYSGTRNTGADVRVEEMVRQFRHVFGDDSLELSILTIDPELSRGYFRTVRQLHLPQLFPKYLFDAVHRHHGVVACEGSMFKSKFANALATMMVGALGLASAEGKLAIGYGGEAGHMDPSLEDLVRRYCREAFIITRNEESREVLAKLGIASRPGTDTAWTFEPAPQEVGRALLQQAGWDGETPVVAICPINPFWWPVRPDAFRGATRALSGAHAESHYSSIYFHADSPEIREKQRRYLEGLAAGLTRFRAEHHVFPILVGMEQLDRRACEALRDILGEEVPIFVSDEHDMYQMVSVVRQASAMVSSRYHAIVTSMPAQVPSGGVTMDERIRNLMADRGQPELALEVDDPALGDHVYEMLVHLTCDAAAVRTGIGDCVVNNLERMGRMGMAMVEHVRSSHPDFPFRPGMGADGDPWDHLPTLSPELNKLVAAYRDATRARPPEPHARRHQVNGPTNGNGLRVS